MLSLSFIALKKVSSGLMGEVDLMLARATVERTVQVKKAVSAVIRRVYSYELLYSLKLIDKELKNHLIKKTNVFIDKQQSIVKGHVLEVECLK